ncbi:hypothetical protein AXX16_1303 [Serratia rubidaea]|nr:hypothetical protein AXX16_1303 [Serratia rubidaea]
MSYANVLYILLHNLPNMLTGRQPGSWPTRSASVFIKPVICYWRWPTTIWYWLPARANTTPCTGIPSRQTRDQCSAITLIGRHNPYLKRHKYSSYIYYFQLTLFAGEKFRVKHRQYCHYLRAVSINDCFLASALLPTTTNYHIGIGLFYLWRGIACPASAVYPIGLASSCRLALCRPGRWAAVPLLLSAGEIHTPTSEYSAGDNTADCQHPGGGSAAPAVYAWRRGSAVRQTRIWFLLSAQPARQLCRYRPGISADADGTARLCPSPLRTSAAGNAVTSVSGLFRTVGLYTIPRRLVGRRDRRHTVFMAFCPAFSTPLPVGRRRFAGRGIAGNGRVAARACANRHSQSRCQQSGALGHAAGCAAHDSRQALVRMGIREFRI